MYHLYSVQEQVMLRCERTEQVTIRGEPSLVGASRSTGTVGRFSHLFTTKTDETVPKFDDAGAKTINVCQPSICFVANRFENRSMKTVSQ